MVDVKEISSIKIAPFTLMSSSISSILAFIAGILFALAAGLVALILPPQLAPLASLLTGLGLTMIIAYPILTFFVGLSVVFYTLWVYNALAPKVGGVKLDMDGNSVAAIPIVPFALILSIIEAIWMFIIGLVIVTGFLPITGAIGSAIPLIANATNGTATGAGFGSLVALGAIFFIVIMPILVFIFGFIAHALIAIFYNFIAVRAAKIQLNFEAMTEGWHKLTDIPILPAALAIGVVFAVVGFLYGLLSLVTLAGVGDIGGGILALVLSTIIYFVQYFIVAAIAVFLYNVLAPRIGAIKLQLQ